MLSALWVVGGLLPSERVLGHPKQGTSAIAEVAHDGEPTPAGEFAGLMEGRLVQPLQGGEQPLRSFARRAGEVARSSNVFHRQSLAVWSRSAREFRRSGAAARTRWQR